MKYNQQINHIVCFILKAERILFVSLFLYDIYYIRKNKGFCQMRGSILNRFNSDDSFFRATVIGLLNLMNNKLSIWNRLEEDDYEDVPVPFYYAMSGDERFMQDLFFGDSIDDCIEYKTVEGNITSIPSGTVKISSIAIDTARATNRLVRGEYTKMSEGEIKTFNSFQNKVPINIGFEVEIRMDSQLDLMKMVERLIQTFYKTFVFSIVFKGSVIECQAGFPEEYTSDKPYEFAFGDTTEGKINFNLEVETYYPIIDTTQEFRKDQQILSFTTNITDDIFSNLTPSANNDTYVQHGTDVIDNTTIPSNSKNFLGI